MLLQIFSEFINRVIKNLPIYKKDIFAKVHSDLRFLALKNILLSQNPNCDPETMIYNKIRTIGYYKRNKLFS